MKYLILICNSFLFAGLLSLNVSCQGDEEIELNPTEEVPEAPAEKDYKLADIDLSNWKVTLPIGSPTEVEPPAILDYATNETLKPFMYNDSTDGSIVFYTYPAESTRNSKYSRTELREQMVPGSNSVNWSFEEGGSMGGTLSVPEVSVNSDGEPDRLMVMQIHGRLSNEQRDLIEEDDNNAPPVLKIYWDQGRIWVRTKVLKDINTPYPELLHTDAWTDDVGRYFEEEVGNGKFSLQIIAEAGRMEVILNEDEKFIYESEDLEKWNVFENYFKAGNYLMSTDSEAFSKVKYYELEVKH